VTYLAVERRWQVNPGVFVQPSFLRELFAANFAGMWAIVGVKSGVFSQLCYSEELLPTGAAITNQ